MLPSAHFGVILDFRNIRGGQYAAPLPKARQHSFYSSTPSDDGLEFVTPVTLDATVYGVGGGGAGGRPL